MALKFASRATPTNLVIRFYDSDVQAKDFCGRTQQQILSWSNAQLEACHNYIQMLFPLPEGSLFNFEAPVINREVFDAFRSRSELRSQLRKSYERMLKFYGFKVICTLKSDKEPQEDGGKKDNEGKSTTSATNANTAASSSENPGPTSSENDSLSTSKSPLKPSPSSPVTYSIVRGPNWHNIAARWCVRFNHNHLRITRILRCLRVLGLQTECDDFYKVLQQAFDDPAFSISDTSMTFWTRAVQRPLYLTPDDEECEWLKEWELGQQQRDTD